MKGKPCLDLVKFQSMRRRNTLLFQWNNRLPITSMRSGSQPLRLSQWKMIQPFSCYITLAWLQSRQNLVHFFPSLPWTQSSFPFICDGVCTRLIIYRNLQYLIIMQAFFTLTCSFRATICPLTPQDNVKASNDEKCSYQAGYYLELFFTLKDTRTKMLIQSENQASELNDHGMRNTQIISREIK